MLSFRDLIVKVLKLYGGRFRHILPIIGLPLIWNVALAFIPIEPDRVLLVIGPILLVSFLISSYTELLLVSAFSRLLENQTMHAKTIFISALKRLPLFLPAVLLWAAMLVAGIIFAVFPAIIFATWFMFFSSAFMIEGRGPLSALTRSKALTNGNFFALLLRAGSVVLMLFFIATTAGQGFLVIFKTLMPDSALGMVTIISNVFASTLSVLSLPIITGTMVVLYYEMRKTKPL